jgi:hypothetical protein
VSNPIIDKFKLFDMLGYQIKSPEVRRFHESTARKKMVIAAARSGKSYSAAMDVLTTILMPNTRVWVVGPNYTLAEKEFRYIHEMLVINRHKLGLPKPVTCYTAARTGQLFIKFPWGSIVEGKTAERPDALLGEAIDGVIYSEASQLSRSIRERYVEPRTITKQGWEIFPTTPNASAEWLHELDIIGQSGEYEGFESFHWDVLANPVYPEEEFERAKKFYGADSPVFREQYLGEWVFYGGLVYSTFREDLHVIEPFDIPKSWKRIPGIDFGHRDPFVCLSAAMGPEGEIYIYREYYDKEGRSMREYADRIKESAVGEDYILGVADPESPQSIEDLNFEGVAVQKANNDRRAGRMRVLEFLLPTEDGVCPYPLRDLPARHARSTWPRMYIFNTCKETIREFKHYRWSEGKSKEGDKERTEGDDHAMDVVRYLCMTRPSPFKQKTVIPSMSFMGQLGRMKTARNRQRYIGMGR